MTLRSRGLNANTPLLHKFHTLTSKCPPVVYRIFVGWLFTARMKRIYLAIQSRVRVAFELRGRRWRGAVVYAAPRGPSASAVEVRSSKGLSLTRGYHFDLDSVRVFTVHGVVPGTACIRVLVFVQQGVARLFNPACDLVHVLA